MITALRTLWPRWLSAASLSLRRMNAEISGGVYSLPPIAHLDEVVGPADDLVGDHLLLGLDLAVAPAHEPLDRVDRPLGVGDGLPLGRLADEGLALAGEGDDRGVSRLPSWLGMTVASPPSITATTLLVVPRSMPMIFSPSATVDLLSGLRPDSGISATLSRGVRRQGRRGPGHACVPRRLAPPSNSDRIARRRYRARFAEPGRGPVRGSPGGEAAIARLPMRPAPQPETQDDEQDAEGDRVGADHPGHRHDARRRDRRPGRCRARRTGPRSGRAAIRRGSPCGAGWPRRSRGRRW